MKKMMLWISIALLLAACGNNDQSESHQTPDQDKSAETEQSNEENQDAKTETLDESKEPTREEQLGPELVLASEDPDNIHILVNKVHFLPEEYVPADLVVPNVPFSFEKIVDKRKMRKEAATALETLFQASEQAGIDLVAASGYRSYERQATIYQSNVEANGKEHADKFSAQPGSSEHQSGLAMDVTSAEVAFALEQTFEQTNEGTWLAENAHKFGFVIRYPEGKEEITGYSYEPWHIRYVGKEMAEEIFNRGITLEEYYELQQ
ncbi:M15 family metallopeptidase [Radiobacillus kanasensis]|uniref:M15 family metallopeptidase n=1 Tax=Radiobacillus kanasensis TaxID=2844358 RepID=UPI001E3526E3|nr:M15 family metallopeptidase [Radiobacillus kanasensis]UFU00458.1 M15 family metallopeptidase [Radiobacillus kanasensis]